MSGSEGVAVFQVSGDNELYAVKILYGWVVFIFVFWDFGKTSFGIFQLLMILCLK